MENIENLVLFKDQLMLVINKPTGMAVHPGPSKQPSLEDYFDALKFGLPEKPALAHRLDRDTSGCLVLGRHRKALAKLGKLFADTGKIEKKYWAICHAKEGVEVPPEGIINAPLLKINTKRGWRIVIDPKGQESITEYKVLGKIIVQSRHPGFAKQTPGPHNEIPAPSGRDDAMPLLLIEASPKTGRTHQIRIHLKSIGCPIVGDPFYGFHRQDNEMIKSAKEMAAENSVLNPDQPNLFLHARSIKIPLYPNRDPIYVEAPPPPHMAEKLKLFGF